MTNYNRSNSSGGNRSFGKPRFQKDRPEMFKATCANCGNACEVPFRPTGSKPVLCKDCFRNEQGSEGRSSDQRSSSNRSFDRRDSRDSNDRQMFDAVCSNCGDNCQIPFRPSQGRDVFCSRCFDMNKGSDSARPERRSFDRPRESREDNRNQSSSSNYQVQFDALNAKMDKILSLLSPVSVEIAPLESEIDKETIEEIVDEVQEEEKEVVEKKPKKAKAAAKEKTPKVKKAPSKKK